MMKFVVTQEPAEEDRLNVSAPPLDGCFTQDETEEEALANAREAIQCYMESFEKVNEIQTRLGVMTNARCSPKRSSLE